MVSSSGTGSTGTASSRAVRNAQEQGRSVRKAYSNADLLQLTKAVAMAACPEAPKSVSQRTFNAARETAGYPACPEASYIVKRLQYPWSEFLQLALTEEGNSFKALASHTREWGQPDLRTCALALRAIAHRLQVTSVRPNEYAKEREAIIRRARGRNRVRLEEQLPTHGQVERHGWDEVLRASGLEGRPLVPRVQGVPMPDAIERFLIIQGRLPSHTDIIRFAKEQGFALGKNKHILADIEELRERRSREGLWTPARCPKPTQRPPWQSSTVPRLDAVNPRVRRGYWTLERVEAGLRLAVESLKPREQLTVQILLHLSKTSDEIPAPSVVGRVSKEYGTTFSVLRAQASETTTRKQAR